MYNSNDETIRFIYLPDRLRKGARKQLTLTYVYELKVIFTVAAHVSIIIR